MKVLTTKISGNEIRQQVVDEVISFSSPNEAIQSWADNFILVKENSTTEGLRNPQVGAIHSILSHWTHTEVLPKNWTKGI